MAQVNVDLMIGDWVIDTEFEERPRVDVVECIEPNRVMLRHGILYTPIEFIKPIPLTAEILEKNGFSDNYAVDDQSYAVDAGGDVVGVHIIGKGGVMDEMYFKYVHELQHALRLCGIEKEIII